MPSPLISFYRRLYDVTDGAVTPLIGGTLADLGYDADYRLTPRDTVRPTPAWDDVMTWDGPLLRTTAPRHSTSVPPARVSWST